MPAYAHLLPAYPYSRQLSEETQKLLALHQKKVAIVPTIVIGPQVLKKISKKNHLLVRLLALHNALQSQSEHEHLLAAFKTHILKQSIPHTIAHEIFALYHQHLGGAQVRIVADSSKSTVIRRAHGDNNILQALLEVWAEAIISDIADIQRSASTLNNYTFLIQMSPKNAISGTIFTSHHRKRDTKNITITCDEHDDWYAIDVRTTAVTHRPKQTAGAVLSESALQLLARIGVATKRQFFGDHQLTYLVSKQGVYVSALSQFSPPSAVTQQQRHTRMTPILQAVSSPRQAQSSRADGILFSSEYTFAAFGIHPASALKLPQKRDILDKRLQNAIYKHAQKNVNKLFLYKAYDFTTTHLKHLQYAPIPSKKEGENPLLGMRGALHLAHTPQMIRFQVDALNTIMQRTHNPTGFVVPFVRNISEFNKIRRFLESTTTPLWMEIGTPQMMLQPQRIVSAQPAGVVVDVAMLAACVGGFDPHDQYITHFYLPYLSVIATMLHTFANKLHAHEIRVFVRLKTDYLPLLESMLEGVQIGYIVSPKSFAQVESAIQRHEKKTLKGAR